MKVRTAKKIFKSQWDDYWNRPYYKKVTWLKKRKVFRLESYTNVTIAIF